MPRITYTTFSLTYSPNDDNKVLIPHSWFKEFCSHYIIGTEHTQKGMLHLQCGIQTVRPQHAHNLKTTFTRALGLMGVKLTKEQNKVAVKIKPHADWMYLVGYCLKECKDPIMQPKTFFTKETIDEANSRYDSGQAMYNGFKRASNKLTVDQLADLIISTYHYNYPDEPSIHQSLFNDYIRCISKYISFSTYQKIRHESLFEYVNHRLSLIERKFSPSIIYKLYTDDKIIKNKILSDSKDKDALSNQTSEEEISDTESCTSSYREEFESVYDSDEEPSRLLA